jgi:hypothetical protein
VKADRLSALQGMFMNRKSAIFLQVVIVLVGMGALAFVLSAPQKNFGDTFAEKYLNWFVAYTYAMAIPFFVALFQAFKLFGFIGRNETFSPGSVRALRNIKYCALAIIGFVVISFLFMIGAEREDRPAGIFMRLLVSVPSMVAATAAAIFERIFQNAVELKSENDLTV